MDKNKSIGKPKRICCRAGDVFCVEVEGLHKRYFQYLGRDDSMLGGSLIRVFKKRYHFGFDPSIEDIISDDVDFYRYSWIYLGVKQGYWFRVGTSKILGDLSNIYFIYNSSISTLTESKEHWGIIRAFNGIHHKLGELPVKYQIYETDGITPPQYLYKHICAGYNYRKGPRFIKMCKLGKTKTKASYICGLEKTFRSIISKRSTGQICRIINEQVQECSFGLYCEVTARLEETTVDGLPTADEQRVLDKLEEILDYIVKGPDLDNPEGVYIGHRIGDGLMVSVWMVRDSEKVEFGLNRYLDGSWCLRCFEFRFERDEPWTNATNFINGTSDY